MDSALRVAFSTVTFPCVVVSASSLISGEASASRNARASSTPGSVSIMIRVGFISHGATVKVAMLIMGDSEDSPAYEINLSTSSSCRQGGLGAELCCCECAAGTSIADSILECESLLLRIQRQVSPRRHGAVVGLYNLAANPPMKASPAAVVSTTFTLYVSMWIACSFVTINAPFAPSVTMTFCAPRSSNLFAALSAEERSWTGWSVSRLNSISLGTIKLGSEMSSSGRTRGQAQD